MSVKINVPPIISGMIEKLNLETNEAQNAYQTLWSIKTEIDKAMIAYKTRVERKIEQARQDAKKSRA